MARGYRRLSPEVSDEIWVAVGGRAGGEADGTGAGSVAGTVRAYLVRCGGIRPAPRRRAPGRLSLAEREEISRGLAAGLSMRAIAAGLGRAPSTVSREVAAQRWPGQVSGARRGSGGLGAGGTAEAVQAGSQPGAA